MGCGTPQTYIQLVRSVSDLRTELVSEVRDVLLGAVPLACGVYSASRGLASELNWSRLVRSQEVDLFHYVGLFLSSSHTA